MDRQLQTTKNPNPNSQQFPSTSLILRPQQSFSFYNTSTYHPQPSPPINPPPFKRQRTLQTPIDHKTLCQIKKVERQTIKSMSPCTTHQRGMIEIPYQILRCVQAQGLKLNRTNETVEYLREQVSSLHEMIKTALRSFKQPSKYKDSTTTSPKTPHPLLPPYLALVTQTLETLKTNPPPPNELQSTSESISKLNQLIKLQCNFDSLEGSSKEPNRTSNDSSVVGLTLPTTPSIESVRKTLEKMEQNLKTFVGTQESTKKESSRNLAQATMSRNESSRAMTPFLKTPSSAAPMTSTPAKTNRNLLRCKRTPAQKHKAPAADDDDVDSRMMDASFGDLSVIPHSTNTRSILTAKGRSFMYQRNSMDVD